MNVLKSYTRTELIYVSEHMKTKGEDWDLVKLDLAPSNLLLILLWWYFHCVTFFVNCFAVFHSHMIFFETTSKLKIYSVKFG